MKHYWSEVEKLNDLEREELENSRKTKFEEKLRTKTEKKLSETKRKIKKRVLENNFN